MMTYFKATVLMLTAICLLTACSKKPTIQEGDLYLKAQAERVKLDTYRQQVQAAKQQLTQVLPPFVNPNPALAVEQLPALATYLQENDCTQEKDFTRCYWLTRLRLIETTKQLDDANDRIYGGQKTINQLINSINTIVDGMSKADK